MSDIRELFSTPAEQQYAMAVMAACENNLQPHAVLVNVDPDHPLLFASDTNSVLDVLVDEGMLLCERWENSDIYGVEVPSDQKVFFWSTS